MSECSEPVNFLHADGSTELYRRRKAIRNAHIRLPTILCSMFATPIACKSNDHRARRARPHGQATILSTLTFERQFHLSSFILIFYPLVCSSATYILASSAAYLVQGCGLGRRHLSRHPSVHKERDEHCTPLPEAHQLTNGEVSYPAVCRAARLRHLSP